MSPRFAYNNDGSATQTNQSRRRFLLGIGVLTTALAGCASDEETDNSADDDSDDDSSTDTFDPASELAYGEWLTTEEDRLLFAYANLDEIPEGIVSSGPSDPSVDDPLVLYPLAVSGVVVGLGRLLLPYAGLGQAINPEESSDSTVSELTVVNGTAVAEGTFATGRLDERLTEPTDETFGVAHEQTGTIGDYDRYEPVEIPDAVENAPIVAVTDETVVVSRDADRLEQTIATGDGDQSRIFEADETVAELLEQGGTGDLVVGQLGVPYEQLTGGGRIEPDPQFEPRSGEDVIASIAFDTEGDSIDSEFALAASDIDEDRRETIETSFGSAAVDGSKSVEVNSDRITATGSYDAEQLTGGSAEQELSQAAAAELVSPEALTFQYEPPRGEAGLGQLWVTVTEDTDAAGIRVESDSGGANEIRPQSSPIRAGSSVVAPVDPAGDTVTVFAVNDEGATGELVTQSVPTDELSEAAANQAIPEDALSFSYESPDAGNVGQLTIEVVRETDADTLVAQPQEAMRGFTGRVGSLNDDESVSAGTILETNVEPEGDEVIVYATVDDATGEVARWQGPD